MMKKSEIVELIYKSVPDSYKIINLDFEKESDAVRFEWRGGKFRISLSSHFVEEVDGSMLSRSNVAILMESIIKMNL